MKKTFCILIVLILMSGACASADQHLTLSFVFPVNANSVTENIDLYEQAGKTVAVSSLFPEYAAEIGQGSLLSLTDIRMILSLNPELLSGAIGTADSILMSWINPLLSAPEYGAYSGELFDSARSVCTGEGLLSDLITHIRRNTEKVDPEDPSGTANAVIRLFAERFVLQFGETDPVLIIRCYDEGRYLTIHFMVLDEVQMVASLDRSADTDRHVLITSREDNRYYIRKLSSRSENDRVVVSSSLRSSGSSSLFSPDTQLLFSTDFSLEMMSGQEAGFEWMLKSDALKEPMIASGAYSFPEKNVKYLNAGVRIGDNGKEVLQISIRIEPLENAVSFENKTYIPTEKGNAGIMMTALTNLSALAAVILPSLPNEYQKIILDLLN